MDLTEAYYNSKMRWLPLESNPDVMNKYMANLGLPSSWQFSDVYGLDADLLAIVQKPVVAVSLLYPLSDKTDATEIGKQSSENSLYFVKQTIGNACGTMCLIHAVLNNMDSIELEKSKHLIKFFEATKGMSPTDRASHLENDSEFEVAHGESALEGQTQAPGKDEDVKCHFVAFVHHSGGLWELDGRKDEPVLHGPTTPETLLEDTAVVVKKFMERDPEEVNFSVVALNKAA